MDRKRQTQKQGELPRSLSLSLFLSFFLPLSVCLPPSLPPLLSCDVFWPDSMAPGRQWHDHRIRGQKGHSSLLVNLEMSFGHLRPGSFSEKTLWVHAWFSPHSRIITLFGACGERSVLGLCISVLLLILPHYHRIPPLMPKLLNVRVDLYFFFFFTPHQLITTAPQWLWLNATPPLNPELFLNFFLPTRHLFQLN